MHFSRRSLGLPLLFTTLATAPLAAGCGSSSTSTNDNNGTGGNGATPSCYDDSPGCAVATSVAHDDSPKVSDADRAALAKGNEAFALAFAQKIQDSTANTVFSPYSLSTALGMSYAGARSTTATAMASALHFDLPEARLASAFDDLSIQIAARDKSAPNIQGGGFHLRTANAFWKQTGYEVEQPFADELVAEYDSNIWLADFGDAAGAVKLIDGWVSDVTAGKIPSLLFPDNVKASTKLVLVNAIYFSSAWASPFEESATHDGDFHAAGGTTVKAKMMHGFELTTYAAGDDYEAVDLGYAGTPVSMTIVMPKEGMIDDFQASLDAAKLDVITSAMMESDVEITMPKFSFSFGGTMRDALTKLGMSIAFCDDEDCPADFTGIDKAKGQLGIQDVIHKAQIDVGETGTEAAAATAVIMGSGSSAAGVTPQASSIVLDHPFLFFIRDQPTGAVLFAGRVNDPTAK